MPGPSHPTPATTPDPHARARLAFPLWPEAAFLQRLLRGQRRGGRRGLGSAEGAHSSSRRGAGQTFFDHRPYLPGDDLRHLDWNAFARLGRPLSRTYEKEGRVPWRVLVDASASMGVGSPSKLDLAWRLAAALAFAARGARDPVDVHLARGGLEDIATSGSPQHLAEALARVEARGPTDLAAVATALGRRPSGRALVWISDFYDHAGMEAAVTALRREVHPPLFVQLEAPADRGADERLQQAVQRGERVVLVDAESADTSALTLSQQVIAAFERQRLRYNDAVARFCRARGIRWLQVRSDAPFEATALRLLRQLRLGA